MSKSVNLIDLLEIIGNFLNNPSEENLSALNDAKQSLEVRPYLPLKLKENVAKKVIFDLKVGENDQFSVISSLEVGLTFDVLLAYTNIDMNYPEMLKDYEYYDFIWASGVGDYILSFCENDYKTVVLFTREMLSFDHLLQLSELIEQYTPESVDKLTREFERFRLETDTQTLHDLAVLTAGNDPILQTVKENIETGAAEAVNQISNK